MAAKVGKSTSSAGSKSNELKTIALTGSTGFIGQHIIQQARLLGYDIKALTRYRLPPRRDVKWVLGDLHSPDALAELVSGVDAVIHTAGLVKARHLHQFERVNVEGSHNLAQAIVERTSDHPIHMVHFSSLAAREPHLSHYALSKNLSEKAVENILGKDKKMPFTILRPPAVYGPMDTELLPLLRAMQKGYMPIPAKRENRFSIIHASDLARAALLSVGEKKAYWQTFELADQQDQGYRMEDMGKIVSDILERPIRPLVIPAWVLKSMGHILNLSSKITKKPSMLTHLKANELSHPNWVSTENLLNKTKFWQADIDLQQGLEETIKWYKNEGLL